MADSNSGSGFGVAHLADMPITLTFGMVLIGVIILLVVLRFFFADVTVRGGVR